MINVNRYMFSVTRIRQATCAVLVLLLAACGPSDPREAALDQTVMLMTSIVKSHVLADAVRNADPQMRASTAVLAATSGGVTASFPRPPESISITDSIEPQTWSVILRGDDVKKRVIIEGYGEDLQKPLIQKSIDFPP
jgi:hypothetical protein